jgi:hypothetical protein
MVDHATRVAQQLATIPTVQSKLGTFVQRDGFQAVVNLGDSTVTLPFVGMYLPPAGHPVQLEMRDGQLVVSGPARPLPGVGVITGTGTPLAEVTAWDVPYSLPYNPTYTPVLGDDVTISWTGDGGQIDGKRTAAPAVVVPETRPGGGSQLFHPAPFTAVGSGSFGSRWFTNDVYSSSNNTGAWFYANKVADTIPDHAEIVSARIYLPARQATGAAPNLQLHTSPTQPGGPVGFTGAAYPLPVRSGWVDIPLAFIDYLKANPGGIGMNHGGYNRHRLRCDEWCTGYRLVRLTLSTFSLALLRQGVRI